MVFSGFFGWVFLGGFFIANPDQVEVRDLTASAQLSHVLHTVDLAVEMQYSPVGELWGMFLLSKGDIWCSGFEFVCADSDPSDKTELFFPKKLDLPGSGCTEL